MNGLHFLVLVILVGGHALMLHERINIAETRVIAAISDSGCASHQPPAPEYKQRIETYNLSSLKGNK
jgi:hypothetical protein